MFEDKNTEDQSEDTSTEDTSTDDSEDTSEEDTEDTSDDDSEEESDDESEDSSEEVSDEDESEGRKQLRKFFADPKSVPKELRPAFKALQAQFTRKMQSASAVITRAQAFDKIVADPEFREWAKKRAQNLKSTRGRNSEEEEDDSDTEEGNGKLTSKSIQKMIRSAVSEALEPMRKEQQDEQIKSEFRQFRKSHPDWEIYREEMKELMDEHPTLTYDMAYKFATQGIDSEEMRKRSIKSKKNAKTSKPSSTQGKETVKPAKGISVRDSYALAKKMLGLTKGK